ncbi:MAG TPA: hypothetical protein VNS10_09680 [Gemmatimonadaceae bacterium]|jgi:photosystem II stability/assembly factor-like uncharacterized protein|nr:hypothetical protein [Gemmatimonadaceae bacterium]
MKSLIPCLLAGAHVASAQWAPQPSGTTAEFRGLSAVSGSVVWASGTRGRVAHTSDGGKTWKIDTVPGAAALDLRAIFATSGRRVWTMSAGLADSNQAQIFHTEDGARWSRQFTTFEKGVFLDALAFWDDDHGIALSDPADGKLFVIVTDNGGKVWTRFPADRIPAMLPGEAAFAASGTCLVVQGSSNVWIGTGGAATARVFRSTDRGRTWSVADTPVHAGSSASGIFSVAFSDATHGVVVGGDYTKPKQPFDNVAITSDGGATWRIARGPMPLGYMSGVAFVPGTSGRSLVAVGLGGTARSDDAGESWTMIDSVAYNTVMFATRDDGWAVGPRGRIAKWTPTLPPRKP